MRPAIGKQVMPFPQFDITAAYSPTDNVAVHIRALLVNLAVEVAPRWRFMQSDGLDLAVAPSFVVGLGHRDRGNWGDDDHATEEAATFQGRLPLLATIRMNDYADAMLAAFGGFSRIPRQGQLEGDEWPYAEYAYRYQGLVSIVGAAIGLAVQGDTYRVKPTLEWARYVRRHDAASDAPAFERNDIFTLSIAWERTH
jgi:hypothetical protein